MKKSLLTGLIVLSMVLCSAVGAMADIYQFTLDYGTVGTADVDYLPNYNDGETSNISDFNVTSTDISLDYSRASYCVDIFDTISKGTYYGELLDISTVVSDPSGNTRNYIAAATLLEQYGAAYDADNDNLEEQLQLSIWETLYETAATYDLSSGAFSSADYAFLTIGTGFDISRYKVLRFTDASGNYTDKQDLLVQINRGTPNVPIPGAVWLLGSGLLGLIGVRRKRK